MDTKRPKIENHKSRTMATLFLYKWKAQKIKTHDENYFKNF